MKTSTMLTVIVLTLLSSFFTLTLAAPVTDTALNLLPNGTTLNAYKNAATELKQYAATQLSPNYAIKMTGSTDYAVSIAPTNSGGKSKQAVILLCGGFFWEGCDHTVVTDGKCAMVS
jgi:hypothetical protein